MDPEVAKVLAQYGLSGILLGIVGWIFWRIGLRMIASIDRAAETNAATGAAIVAALHDHTKTDLEHHAEVREEIIGVRERLDAVLDVTPVHGHKRAKTNPQGYPAGYYGPRKPARDEE